MTIPSSRSGRSHQPTRQVSMIDERTITPNSRASRYSERDGVRPMETKLSRYSGWEPDDRLPGQTPSSRYSDHRDRSPKRSPSSRYTETGGSPRIQTMSTSSLRESHDSSSKREKPSRYWEPGDPLPGQTQSSKYSQSRDHSPSRYSKGGTSRTYTNTGSHREPPRDSSSKRTKPSRYWEPGDPLPSREAKQSSKRPPEVDGYGSIIDLGVHIPAERKSTRKTHRTPEQEKQRNKKRKKERKAYPIIYHINKTKMSKAECKRVAKTAYKIEKEMWKIVNNDRGVFQPKESTHKGEKVRLKPLVYFLVGISLRLRRSGNTFEKATEGCSIPFGSLDPLYFKVGKWKPSNRTIRSRDLWRKVGPEVQYFLPFISMLFDVREPKDYLKFLKTFQRHMILKPGEPKYMTDKDALQVVMNISSKLYDLAVNCYGTGSSRKKLDFKTFCDALFETSEVIFWHSQYEKTGVVIDDDDKDKSRSKSKTHTAKNPPCCCSRPCGDRGCKNDPSPHSGYGGYNSSNGHRNKKPVYGGYNSSKPRGNTSPKPHGNTSSSPPQNISSNHHDHVNTSSRYSSRNHVDTSSRYSGSKHSTHYDTRNSCSCSVVYSGINSCGPNGKPSSSSYDQSSSTSCTVCNGISSSSSDSDSSSCYSSDAESIFSSDDKASIISIATSTFSEDGHGRRSITPENNRIDSRGNIVGRLSDKFRDFFKRRT